VISGFDKTDMSPLFFAIRQGDQENLEVMADVKTDFTTPLTSTKLPPLNYAAASNVP
jgi:hypothetical protein